MRWIYYKTLRLKSNGRNEFKTVFVDVKWNKHFHEKSRHNWIKETILCWCEMSEFYLTACLNFMTPKSTWLWDAKCRDPNVENNVLWPSYLQAGNPHTWARRFFILRRDPGHVLLFISDMKSTTCEHYGKGQNKIKHPSCLSQLSNFADCLVNFSSRNANGLEWNRIYISSFPVYYNDRHNYSSCYICWWIDMTNM